ncbi:GNAT family N-acetyltransferase [Bacillus sp. EAC]|uniref:GNAT family N-acetyltransferase n=1 Tax=Bacillus sp. EAC TaxID=1978338 RepID=UPI000B42E64E|nr:GNAT family N-acetyltransferase [Bacillus sp. EAC]
MTIILKPVTRENWEEAMDLQVNESQKNFVPSVSVSLAKVYIKPDGENVEYLPFAIYDDQKMVGFMMHAYEENTTYSYWINGFIIDQKYQGNGYGKSALKEMINWITSQFSQCEEIRLTVNKENKYASNIYQKLGFQPTGDVYGDEEVYMYPVKRMV